MKSQKVCSDEKLGVFLLSCMKIAVASKKLAKEINEMTKQVCQICGQVDECYTCESCGKRCCQDHITRQLAAPDDYLDLCTNCLEKE